MKYYLGIDPGSSSGAFALLLPTYQYGKIINWGFVTKRFKDYTEPELCEILNNWVITAKDSGGAIEAILEDIHLMPKQGISSGGKFMRNKGLLEGFLMALKIPYKKVSPQRWVKHYGMKKDPLETKTQWKNKLRQRAQELFPDVKIQAETADAILLANYLKEIL